MKNLTNFGLVEGRLTRDVTVFSNSDGSRKVLLTLAVKDPWAGKDGARNAQFVNLQGFVSAEKAEKGLGPYAFMHKGDLVCFEYSVRSLQYERDGRMVYDQILQIETVAFKERKAVTEARANKDAATEASNMDATSWPGSHTDATCWPGSHADADIGDIESGPVRVPEVEVEKVDNFPHAYPVHQIADGATHDESETGPEQRGAAAFPDKHDNGPGGHKCGRQKEPELPVDVRAVEESECGAPVAHAHYAEKAGNDGYFACQRKIFDNPELRKLIQRQNGCGSGEENAPPGRHQLFPSLWASSSSSMCAQRGHTSGWAGSAPISVE